MSFFFADYETQNQDYPTEKEGYLMKQGGGTFSYDWKRRWIVLKGPLLSYYKDTKDKLPAGAINIMEAQIGIVKDRKKVGGKDFCFQLETKERVFYFWANTSGEMDAWINTLIDVKNKYSEEKRSENILERKPSKRTMTNPLGIFRERRDTATGRKSTLFSGSRLSIERNFDTSPSGSSNSIPAEEEEEEEDEDDESDNRALIVDTGSGTIRVGWSGSMEPCLTFPSVVATYGEISKVGEFSISQSDVNSKYKSKNNNKRNQINVPVFKLIYPIENGVVKDWDAMTLLWEHIFKVLKIRKSIRRRSVLLSEPPSNPKSNREMMVDLLFRKFKVSQIYIAPQPILALFSSGRTEGVVLDCGECVTQVVPVYDGYIIENAVKRVNWGGRQISEAMMKALVERGYNFHNSTDREVAREIKEELCYVGLDLGKELLNQSVDRSYTPTEKNIVGLKNSSSVYETIVIGPERFMIPEGLFKPTQISQEGEGVVGLILGSIKEASLDIRKTLYENIVISGGSTLFPNFEKRVERDLKAALQGTSVRPIIVAPPDRQNSVWLGGACFASLDTFPDQCLSKEDWEADGPMAIYEKFKVLA